MRIFTIGETTFDISFKNGQPVGACSGGSAYNSAISLGRANIPVSLITTFGTDHIGDLSLEFLKQNRVNWSYVKRFDGRSRLALAFFDQANQAHYSFYPASEELFPDYPTPLGDDIILLGSSFALRDHGREELLGFLTSAREKGALIIYDPNARQSMLDQPENLRKIYQNISLATIVKGSDEDFKHIFGSSNGEEVYQKIENLGTSYLVYTEGKKGAQLFTPSNVFSVPAVETVVLSTIGAGDNFSAGIIYGLREQLGLNQKITELGKQEWEIILNHGTYFASAVCGSMENYIPEDFVPYI